MRFSAIGFQTDRDRDNFVACVRHCLSDSRVCRIGQKLLVRAGVECARVGTYPISIDYEDFATEAAKSTIVAAAKAIRTGLSEMQIILGVDRLDYTKGIPERLTAFETFLQSNRESQAKVSLIQIVVPSPKTYRNTSNSSFGLRGS